MNGIYKELSLLALFVVLAICSCKVYQDQNKPKPFIEIIGVEHETRLDNINSRECLLGCIINENSYVLKNGLDLSEIIYLNDDWTIDRMPTHLALKDAEKKTLEGFLKKK